MASFDLRVLLATALAMCAFAANSLLCRGALGSRAIDPTAFTGLRLASGAITLWLLARGWRRGDRASSWNWPSALALFAYAALFSFAYMQLSTGTGALVLFAFVQITMIAWALFRGEKPRPLQWLGFAMALVGLVALVLPGLSAPPLLGFALMAGSGISWGVYSLRGRSSRAPLHSNAFNFVLTLPFVGLLLAFGRSSLEISVEGVTYAVLSGSLASGLGYALWYAALPHLSATSAAVCQLTVPALASLGGVALLDERLSPRLVIATLLILGGVALALFARSKSRNAA